VINYIMNYTRKDLIKLLHRHSGKHSEPCDCTCPFTGNAIDVLYQFIGVENDLPIDFITSTRKLYNTVSKNLCFGGKNRLVNAASVMYIMAIISRRKKARRYTQHEIGMMFCVSDIAIRERYKEIVRSNKIEILV